MLSLISECLERTCRGGVGVGNYLNSLKPYNSYLKEYDSLYFVDKTLLLEELFSIIGTSTNYVCLTRPRRFGKSVMANMVAAFFSKASDSRAIFDSLKIAGNKRYHEFIGKYDVISISMNEIPRKCKSYEQYIDRIESRLLKDLAASYPKAEINEEDAVWDALTAVFNAYHSQQFIFVIDEWDYIFHRDFVTKEDKTDYIDFLSNLLKDQPYVSLAYMTGILPIAKYSSGSELNMFLEYTMATKVRYSEYFGFTDEEVDRLYEKYLDNTEKPRIRREGLKTWYDGYQTQAGVKIYNPRSVVSALGDNQLSSYWTSAGPYDEIYYYINNNVAAVREDLAQMAAGIPVPAKIQEYAATSMNLTTRDEIFSAMVVYGFLSYENGYVSIPNKELMNKFSDMLMKEPSLGYVHQLAVVSSEMLRATLNGDENKVAEIMEHAHNTETPLLNYNSESELTVLVSLVYLSARDSYRVEREDKAGKGYVDFIFYPETDKNADAFILELKVDYTAEEAIKQIKDRNYVMKFEGKLGEKPMYTGRILGVGIAYDRKAKKHTCKIEVLKNAK
jgi:hypothetical protein